MLSLLKSPKADRKLNKTMKNLDSPFWYKPLGCDREEFYTIFKFHFLKRIR